MIRPIVKYGETDVLHTPAREIDGITPDIVSLVNDMVETMYAAPGIGLAAPQIAVPLRVFVVDLSVGRDADSLITLINPVFVQREGMQLEDEGCLSIPGFTSSVPRPERVVIKGLDREGRERQYEGTGLLARAFQHEMDHLDGRLFVDRLRGIKRDLIVRKIRKLSKLGRW
jgi:peptide deformylase